MYPNFIKTSPRVLEICDQLTASSGDVEDNNWPSVSCLVRRHSLSLLNRSPPPGSISADLLGTIKYNKFENQANQLRSSIKDLAEVISDYNSCHSIMDSSSDDDTTKPTAKEKKKGRKRGRVTSPVLVNGSKKANIANNQ